MVSSSPRRSARPAVTEIADEGPPTGIGPGVRIDEVSQLPWLNDALADTLQRQRGHAILVHGDAGIGALEFAFALARAWLCEEASGQPRPCGQCASCRAAHMQTHPDLLLRLPQALALQHGLAVEADDKRKPSRQIRIAELRDALDWSVTTSGRGRGKVLLLHPAEAMNVVTASALLKTLEEPPAGMRIVLTTADPSLLLPTISSRCQRVVLPRPGRQASLQWLTGRGVPDAPILLDAAGGRPLAAWRWQADGLDARAWEALPLAVARGDASAFSGWPVPRLLDALQKLAHDVGVLCCGGAPRFFAARALPAGADLRALARWQQSLLRVARHAEHPWSEGLLAEALFAEGAQVWQGHHGVRSASRESPLLAEPLQ
jgi:DNA polymerase-3 subunit delta'